MVDKTPDRAAEAYDSASKFGSDAIEIGATAVNETPHLGTGMPGESTSIAEAAESARDAGRDAAADANDAGESFIDKFKEKLGDLLGGEADKH